MIKNIFAVAETAGRTGGRFMAEIKGVGAGPGVPRGPGEPEDASQAGEAALNWLADVAERYRVDTIATFATRRRFLPPPANTAPSYRINALGAGAPEDFPRQVTFVADTFHGSNAISGKFVEILDNFAKSGGKHVVVEAPNQYQILFESIKTYNESVKAQGIGGAVPAMDYVETLWASGWVPDDQKGKARENFAKIMQIALDHGMDFHAREQVIPTSTAARTYPDVQIFIEQLIKRDEAEQVRILRTVKQLEPFSKRLQAYSDMLNEERLASDEGLISYLQEVVEGDQKVMIFRGAGHARPITIGLGEERCQCIFIVNPENHWISRRSSGEYSGLPLWASDEFALGNMVSRYNAYMISNPFGAWMTSSSGYQTVAGRTGFGANAGLSAWAAYGMFGSLTNPASNFWRGYAAGGGPAGAEITGLAATGSSIVAGTARATLTVLPALETAEGLGPSALRYGARFAMPVAVVATAAEAAVGFYEGDASRAARATGAGIGAFAGAAGFGMAFAWTGPGALVAAAIGGVGGAIIGGMAGEAWFDWLVNYAMNMTGKDTTQRADSDIEHAFGPGVADYLVKAREGMKAFSQADLVRDMGKALQAGGEQGKAIHRILQAELLRRAEMETIELAKNRWSGNVWGNVSLTADTINAMTADTIGQLVREGKISPEEGRLALGQG
jgi:hypothetical protein